MDVCGRLGITRPVLLDLLKNITREGHVQKKGRALRVSEAGVQALAAEIARRASADKNAPTGIPEAKNDVRAFRVFRSREQGILNTRVLEAHPSDQADSSRETLWVVRVRDNAHYIPGMLFQARVIGQRLAEAWDVNMNTIAPIPRSRGRL